MKLFFDVKLLVGQLSKEIAQIDLNTSSYWKDIRKLRFNSEKCQVLLIGSKNIEVECKLSIKEIQTVNEECDLRVGFDDIFKTEDHILSILSRSKGMDWQNGKKFYFKVVKCFKNI